MNQPFRVCSTCRAPIGYGAKYFRCSVSTCNQKRLALYFCSVPCWDAHVPGAKHRDAWAEEAVAPAEPLDEAPPLRRIVTSAAPAPDRTSAADSEESDSDVLVVVSKFKKYVTDRSGMNTSQAVMGTLSKHLRAVADRAIQEAQAHGRKTVLDRDVEEAVRKFGRAPDGAPR